MGLARRCSTTKKTGAASAASTREATTAGLDHPRVGVADGTALFTEFGEPSRYLRRIIRAFQDLSSGITVTRSFITSLLQLKLIEPISIEAEFDDGTTRECAGLYTVNQEALSALPDQTVVSLFRLGYLRLIHLMIASLKQVPVLARKKNGRILKTTHSLAAVRA